MADTEKIAQINKAYETEKNNGNVNTASQVNAYGNTSSTTPATTTTTANTTPTSSANTTTTPAYTATEQKIVDMYNASLNANKANLEAQYQQSLSNAQADKEAIGTSYEGQRNNLAAEYERQRRNNDLTANVNGLNTGAGSQMDLAQTANYQSNKAMLAKAQAQEEATADRNLTDLTTQYQIAVNDAIANNDYQKSAALLDEYNNQKADMQNQAQILAQYGNFSGYAQMYGQETADQMQKMWALQNPQLAYSQGMITADEYYQMTGKYPNGYNAGGGGGGYYPTISTTPNTSTGNGGVSGRTIIETGASGGGKVFYIDNDGNGNTKVQEGSMYTPGSPLSTRG